MTIERSGPPRLTDAGPAPLRELVHTERMHGPSADAFARMSKRLTSAAAAAPRSTPTVLSHKIGIIAMAIAGGLALTWSATRQTLEGQVPAATASTLAIPQPTEAPAASAAELPPVSIDDLPPAPARPSHSPAAPPSGSSKTTIAKETELEVLQRAQAALVSDAGRALAITHEHARAYPNGEFAQEREVIAVEALARLGRGGEASQRAHDLLRRFPRTPYAPRLEAALGRPLERTAVENAPTTPAH